MSHNNHHGNPWLAHRIFDDKTWLKPDCIKDSQNSFGSNFLSGSPVSCDDSTNISRWAFDRSSESRRHNRVSGVFDTKHVTRATRFQYSDRARTNSTGSRLICTPYSGFVSAIERERHHTRDRIHVLRLFRGNNNFHTHMHTVFRSCVCDSRRMEKFLGYILCDAENANCECIEKENLWFFFVVDRHKILWKILWTYSFGIKLFYSYLLLVIQIYYFFLYGNLYLL